MNTILIVDDDASLRRLLQIVGRRAGFEVDCASDGSEALEKLQSKEYLVALLDLMMPRLSGYEVIERLRGLPHPPAVVIVTAMNDPTAMLDPSVIHSVIRKPFDVHVVAEMLAAVAEEVRKQRGQDAYRTPAHPATPPAEPTQA